VARVRSERPRVMREKNPDLNLNAG